MDTGGIAPVISLLVNNDGFANPFHTLVEKENMVSTSADATLHPDKVGEIHPGEE